MNATLLITIGVTLISSAVALSLRNLIHSVLLLVITWIGICAFYLIFNAEFIAFTQLLVYVGAISMVALFAVLLTRVAPSTNQRNKQSVTRFIYALITGLSLFSLMAFAVLHTDSPKEKVEALPATVYSIGKELTEEYAPALMITGSLLTLAILGSVLLAAHSPQSKENS